MEKEYGVGTGMGGSNNWVVHKEVSHLSIYLSIYLSSLLLHHSQTFINKQFSHTEGSLMASDPHLEINRLPAIWYEVVIHKPDHDFIAGISVPVSESYIYAMI